MDYDVKAAGLSSPPTSAPVQAYRPSVAVENLGIHSADVTGLLRIYDRDAGTLLATMNVAISAIAPGTTKNAVADALWTPTPADIGRAFLFTASIVYPPDQNVANNNLAPVTVIVTAAEPPPPPPVESHASQHEDGGGDEIDLEGLTGKLAQAQTPDEHASMHEEGGADQLDVTALEGELADPQTPKTHASAHWPGGSDALDEAEWKANKGVASGYAELDGNARLPIARLPSLTTIAMGSASANPDVSCPNGVDTTVLSFNVSAGSVAQTGIFALASLVLKSAAPIHDIHASVFLRWTSGGATILSQARTVNQIGDGATPQEIPVCLSVMDTTHPPDASTAIDIRVGTLGNDIYAYNAHLDVLRLR